ncbi:MAG: response regulator [Myxococcales bacterium]|nr:response regulator [Myxococcales bacterium]
MKKISSDSPVPQAAPTPEKVVLYVEDEASNWEVTELRLRNRFKLVWAKSAEEACAAVRQFGGKFHAVLMDLQLKGSPLDGLQLTRLCRGKAAGFEVPAFAKELPPVDCPIFFVTAFGALHSPEKMDEAGGDAYVPKPVDFVKLSNLLATTAAKKVLASLKTS